MTRSMGDATRSNLTWALEVMAKEYPNRSDYSVELGWNLMVTRQFDNAEEILQVKVRLKSQEQVKPCRGVSSGPVACVISVRALNLNRS